jgi:hypothetical protein
MSPSRYDLPAEEARVLASPGHKAMVAAGKKWLKMRQAARANANTLVQSHDPMTLMLAFAHAITYSDPDGARRYLALYWQCRTEGMEEPFCPYAGFQSADAFMSDSGQRLEAEAGLLR